VSTNFTTWAITLKILQKNLFIFRISNCTLKLACLPTCLSADRFHHLGNNIKNSSEELIYLSYFKLPLKLACLPTCLSADRFHHLGNNFKKIFRRTYLSFVFQTAPQAGVSTNLPVGRQVSPPGQ
jgi:hypothetical protein